MDGQIDPRLLLAVKLVTGVATPAELERFRDEQSAKAD